MLIISHSLLLNYHVKGLRQSLDNNWIEKSIKEKHRLFGIYKLNHSVENEQNIRNITMNLGP